MRPRRDQGLGQGLLTIGAGLQGQGLLVQGQGRVVATALVSQLALAAQDAGAFGRAARAVLRPLQAGLGPFEIAQLQGQARGGQQVGGRGRSAILQHRGRAAADLGQVLADEQPAVEQLAGFAVQRLAGRVAAQQQLQGGPSGAVVLLLQLLAQALPGRRCARCGWQRQRFGRRRSHGLACGRQGPAQQAGAAEPQQPRAAAHQCKPASRAALPPAAAVLMVKVCSALKRYC